MSRPSVQAKILIHWASLQGAEDDRAARVCQHSMQSERPERCLSYPTCWLGCHINVALLPEGPGATRCSNQFTEGPGRGERHRPERWLPHLPPRAEEGPNAVRAPQTNPDARSPCLRGPYGAKDELLLAATAQSLRKLAKLVPAAQPSMADRKPSTLLDPRQRQRPLLSKLTSSTQSALSCGSAAFDREAEV
jgi:hypothetical protein